MGDHGIIKLETFEKGSILVQYKESKKFYQ